MTAHHGHSILQVLHQTHSRAWMPAVCWCTENVVGTIPVIQNKANKEVQSLLPTLSSPLVRSLI